MIVLFICAILVYFALTAQYEYYSKEIQRIKREKASNENDFDYLMIELDLISVAISFLVFCINYFGISFTIQKLVKKEKHSTHTSKKVNLSRRKTLVHNN